MSHDPGISTAQGQLRPGAIEVTTGFAPADVRYFLPSSPHIADRWNEADFEVVREQLEAVAPQLWEAMVGGLVLQSVETGVELLPGDNVSFHVTLPVPADGGRLTLRAPMLAGLPPGHRQFVLVFDQDGSTVAKKLLSPKAFVLEVPLPAQGAPPRSVVQSMTLGRPPAWEFVRRGVGQFWAGLDHLLFLLALLLVCRSFRSGVVVVASLMVAHSLTLAVATLGWASLPPRVAEPLIAASIVYVCCENLWRAGAEPPWRWVVILTFGLAHGFGFANVLRDLGVAGHEGGVVTPLLAFNLGIEIGQVVIAAMALPIIWQLQKEKHFARRWMPVLSALFGAAGLYWLLGRILFA
ncbi:MAG: HupE/UreJ family protein [Opitutus sp.]